MDAEKRGKEPRQAGLTEISTRERRHRGKFHAPLHFLFLVRLTLQLDYAKEHL